MSRAAPRLNNKGFTLVELLVVITIIAVLATIGLVVYSGVQKNARMAKRISDLKAIQTALEIYYSVNKSYPTASGWRSECGGGGVPADQVVWESDTKKLVPQYMPAFPADPQMDKLGDKSCYKYTSNGTDYKLIDIRIIDFGGAAGSSNLK